MSRTKLNVFRWVTLAACAVVFAASPAVAQITDSQRELLRESFEAVQSAGKSYQAKDYEAAGAELLVAMQKAGQGLQDADAATIQKAESILVRIERAHALLQLEGIVLPPFQRPEFGKAWRDYVVSGDKPRAMKMDTASTAPLNRTSLPKPPPSNPPEPTGVSFVSDVAPILISKCGRCHIQGQRGNFSLASYAVLMKGPPEGVVIFPGDPVGSRLIETIETGDMPRGGGKVTADQLATLKQWVVQGAKFDGPAPAAPLPSYAQPVGNAPAGNAVAMNDTPEVTMSTGRETVSFSKDVAPLLVGNCNGCHIDAMQTRGGLNMNTLAQLMRGGDTGPVVNVGSGDESLLIRKLRGQEGARMPAGGRPALPEDSIALISKWIDEGATLDAGTEDQPLRVMMVEAWANSATHEELAERRVQLAGENWKLGASEQLRESPSVLETDDVFVIGSVTQPQLELVAKAASDAMETALKMIPASRERSDSGKAQMRGRITLFVFDRRYDYGEFSKMVEARELPGEWDVHWRYDGVDAYVSLVLPSDADSKSVTARLVSPMASLVTAMRGPAPRWFQEGMGRAVAAKSVARDLDAVQEWREEIPAALGVIKEPKDIVQQRLPPKEMDLIGFGMSEMLLDRQFRRQLDGLLRAIESDTDFEEAFQASYGVPLEAFVTNWIGYVARNAQR